MGWENSSAGRTQPPRALLPPWRAKAGGEGRIRTSEGARPTDLQSVAFDRSATSPKWLSPLTLRGRYRLESTPRHLTHRLVCRRSRSPRRPVYDHATLTVRLVLGTLRGVAGWRTLDHLPPELQTPKKRRSWQTDPTAPGHAPVTRSCFPWSWRRDSNPRPADYKSAALPD